MKQSIIRCIFCEIVLDSVVTYRHSVGELRQARTDQR